MNSSIQHSASVLWISEFVFLVCMFGGFCRVLALVMWKVLTSWGFCGCFDDWQNHPAGPPPTNDTSTRLFSAKWCNSNRKSSFETELVFAQIRISTGAVTTICLIWQIWLESEVWNGGRLQWRWHPLCPLGGNRSPPSSLWHQPLKVFTSSDWIQNNAAAKSFLFKGEHF